jgi:hypothetical protein
MLAAFSVTPKVVARWTARYASLGRAGMIDRSSRPARIPRMTQPTTAERIVASHQREARTLHPDRPSGMGVRPSLPELDKPSRSPPEMATPLQLAPAARQHRLQAADQSPRSIQGQPVEAPQLERLGGAHRDTIVFYRIGEGFAGHTTVLALFLAEAEELAAGKASTLHHLALTLPLAEQEAAIAWFERLGIACDVQTFDWIGWRGVFVRDPEGNSVELVAYGPKIQDSRQ